MVNLLHYPIYLLLADIPWLYYYTILNSSIIFCLSSGDIYLSFGISVSLATVSEVFCGDFFVILLAILSPI